MSVTIGDQQVDRNTWREAVANFQQPIVRRSIWQLVNSIVPYFILWGLMIWSLSVSYWLTLAISVLAAGFVVRIFIIFHDCGHGSFFRTKQANAFWGVITGILTFTPYHQWRHEHAVHHASSGDLDRRGVGDVLTWTVEEYQQASPLKRLGYRFYRHPLVMFGLGSVWTFLLSHRLVRKDATRKERFNVHYTTLALLAIALGMHFVIGIKAFLMIQLPTILLAGVGGIWLFYVQHQFEDMIWVGHEEWDYTRAALEGSSFYKLPRVLQWFSGNIGFHHIHHLSPRIPNYSLEPCLKANRIFQITPLTLLSSFRTIPLRLWDEESGQLVSFKTLKTLRGTR